MSTKSKNDTNFLLDIIFIRRLRISATEQRKTREDSKHTILLSFFHLNIQRNPLTSCAFPSYPVRLKHSLGLNIKKAYFKSSNTYSFEILASPGISNANAWGKKNFKVLASLNTTPAATTTILTSGNIYWGHRCPSTTGITHIDLLSPHNNPTR